MMLQRGQSVDRSRLESDLHGNTDNAVRSVPETNVSSIRSALRWPPGHSEDEDLDGIVEDDSDVPRSEARSANPGTLAAAAKDIDSESHGKIKEGRGVGV